MLKEKLVKAWRKPQLRGMVLSVGAFLLFLGTLLAFHQPIEKNKTQEKVVDLDFKKIERKVKSLTPPPPPPQKKAPPKRHLRPQLNLAFKAGGLDLGLSLSDLNSSSSRLLSQGGDTVMTEDTVDEPPQVRYRSPLKYPESALAKKLEGFVTLYLLVTSSGAVEQVKLLDAAPSGVFEDVALEAVRDWQFEPAEFQGRQVAVWVKQKINFKVN